MNWYKTQASLDSWCDGRKFGGVTQSDDLGKTCDAKVVHSIILLMVVIERLICRSYTLQSVQQISNKLL